MNFGSQYYRTKFEYVDFDKRTIDYIYETCIIEGYSLSYTMSRVKGGMPAFIRHEKDSIRLQEIRRLYRERQKKGNIQYNIEDKSIATAF